MKKSFYRTDYLFPSTSFMVGIGSVLDLFASYFKFNYSSSEKQADSTAIESDFGTIGKDIREVLTTCN